MRKNRLILAAALTVAILGGIVWLLMSSTEPAYGGKSLSTWLREYNSMTVIWPRTFHAPPDEAIQHLGTNAFPMIVERLRYRDSASKVRLIQFLQGHPRLRFAFPVRTQNEYNLQGIAALCALGRDAKPLVPTLAEALDHIDVGYSGSGVDWLMSLGSDGEAAIPAMIQLVKDKRTEMRMIAVMILAAVGAKQTNLVLPVFKECLQDSNASVRGHAINAYSRMLNAPKEPKEFWKESEAE